LVEYTWASRRVLIIGKMGYYILRLSHPIAVKKKKKISMMRGKSLRSDVEMSKTKFRGGHLVFLAAIFD